MEITARNVTEKERTIIQLEFLYTRVLATNPFPGVCARTCPAHLGPSVDSFSLVTVVGYHGELPAAGVLFWEKCNSHFDSFFFLTLGHSGSNFYLFSITLLCLFSCLFDLRLYITPEFSIYDTFYVRQIPFLCSLCGI